MRTYLGGLSEALDPVRDLVAGLPMRMTMPSRPMMQDSERRIMPNVWLRISADTSRLSVQLKGPPYLFRTELPPLCSARPCLDLCGPPHPHPRFFGFWIFGFLIFYWRSISSGTTL
jgi:hypothetical protein